MAGSSQPVEPVLLPPTRAIPLARVFSLPHFAFTGRERLAMAAFHDGIVDHEDAVMEFRWIVFLTLWTVLSGPMLVRPAPGQARSPQKSRAATADQLKKLPALHQ